MGIVPLLALAQDAEPLSEAFLLFLAEGIEVDGEWQDPITLASMAALQEVPDDELAWVADREVEELESMSDEFEDGEDDE